MHGVLTHDSRLDASTTCFLRQWSKLRWRDSLSSLIRRSLGQVFTRHDGAYDPQDRSTHGKKKKKKKHLVLASYKRNLNAHKSYKELTTVTLWWVRYTLLSWFANAYLHYLTEVLVHPVLILYTNLSFAFVRISPRFMYSRLGGISLATC